MVKIFSIKDEYCTKIFENEKLVELRRQNIRIRKNEKCLIYTTSPIKRVTGFFVVAKKVRLPIEKLWDKTRHIAGVTKSQFNNYFKGCVEGTAIFFKYVKKFVNQLTLDEMGLIIKNFRPPQSFYNIDEKIYKKILQRSIVKSRCPAIH